MPRSAYADEPIGELGFPLGVDATGGLVEHEQLRLGDGDGGEPQTLALTAREISRMPVGRPGEPDEAERRPGTLSITAHAKCHLLVDTLADEVAARVLRQVADMCGANDAAGIRVEKARHDPGQRRLATAVGPAQADDLAASDLQLDACRARASVRRRS